MDGDVLYDRRVLAPLIETHHADCVLVDPRLRAGRGAGEGRRR